MADTFQEFTEIYKVHGKYWADTFRKDLAKGWERFGSESDDQKVQRTFIDYARKGYMIYLDKTGPVTAPYYVIYVKKLYSASIPAHAGRRSRYA